MASNSLSTLIDGFCHAVDQYIPNWHALARTAYPDDHPLVVKMKEHLAKLRREIMDGGEQLARQLSAINVSPDPVLRVLGNLERDGRIICCGDPWVTLLPTWETDRIELKRQAMRIEAPADGRESRQQRELRLRISEGKIFLDNQKVSFDCKPESIEAALIYLRHLIDAGGEWMSDGEIARREALHIRWDRVRNNLPECLKELIETHRSKGSRLICSAWHTDGTVAP